MEKLVVDNNGKKHWIDYDKDSYKVGAGMYKSSAKNAMRVARTETNMAYKRADQERYKKFDFILGYHIEPSHNHEPEDCEPDICEQLKGDYPKWFTWEGWHPQCKCQCTPIMMDEDEAIAMFNARDKGKKYTPKGMINEMPQQFKDWCENNKEKIVYSHQRGKDPYFVRHNFDVVKSTLKGENAGLNGLDNNGNEDKNNTSQILNESKNVYNSLSKEWDKVEFHDDSGGFVAKHIYKDKDDLKRFGTQAEVITCTALAKLGKRVLRLPENVPTIIDKIKIDNKTYKDILKFKQGKLVPRGYPDIYFDNMTWDVKSSDFTNVESVRKLICDGRKADNVIFYLNGKEDIEIIKEAIYREFGKRKKDNSWAELPNIYCLDEGQLILLWNK